MTASIMLNGHLWTWFPTRKLFYAVIDGERLSRDMDDWKRIIG